MYFRLTGVSWWTSGLTRSQLMHFRVNTKSADALPVYQRSHLIHFRFNRGVSWCTSGLTRCTSGLTGSRLLHFWSGFAPLYVRSVRYLKDRRVTNIRIRFKIGFEIALFGYTKSRYSKSHYSKSPDSKSCYLKSRYSKSHYSKLRYSKSRYSKLRYLKNRYSK